MATIVVQHRVSDYDAWRDVYDGFADVQQAGGVIAESVHRSKDDPNVVLVLHRFGSMDEAQAFADDPKLRDAMQRGGVEGAPRVEFYEDA
jgi:quinol monooxygenase YgiN